MFKFELIKAYSFNRELFKIKFLNLEIKIRLFNRWSILGYYEGGDGSYVLGNFLTKKSAFNYAKNQNLKIERITNEVLS